MTQLSQRQAQRRRAERQADGSSRDEGFSLVEVMMTIVLISLVIIPLIQATMTSVKASSTARLVAEVDTTLQNAADRVTRAPTNCDYTAYIQAALIAKGWQPSQVSATYEHYVPGTSAELNVGPAPTWAPGGCEGTTRTPRLIQRVTITVRSDGGSIQRTIQVVKSDV